SYRLIPYASKSSRRNGNCSDNSGGVFWRPPLYSLNVEWRNVVFPASNATRICVGFSSSNIFISIVVNPYTAFVWIPLSLFKSGNAKKARYAILFPSININFFFKKNNLPLEQIRPFDLSFILSE